MANEEVLPNIMPIEEIDKIPTLRIIDIFNYDEVCSEYLREDMDKYGKQIF